jgi:hypothetical protein
VSVNILLDREVLEFSSYHEKQLAYHTDDFTICEGCLLVALSVPVRVEFYPVGRTTDALQVAGPANAEPKSSQPTPEAKE